MTPFGTKEIAGYEQGVQAEQERIIKLIEDSVGNMTAEVIIKLIKEGTK
jgi:hypothetical protein